MLIRSVVLVSATRRSIVVGRASPAVSASTSSRAPPTTASTFVANDAATLSRVASADEPVIAKRRRLQYQSRKRGIAENCLLLSTFADAHLTDFDEAQLTAYDRLINVPSNEWDLYYWATGARPVPGEFARCGVFAMFRTHVANADKRDQRFVQPPLTLLS